MKREHWKTRFGFIWAAVGSAVGLGSIWRFPYVVGENGGSTFIVLYLFCLLLVGFPLLVAEIAVGRKTQLNPYGAYRALGGGEGWGSVGKVAIITGFLVSTFYGVISGWTLSYLIMAIAGATTHITSSSDALALFEKVTVMPLFSVGSLFLFMVGCFAVLFIGVRKGIERANTIMMPLLLIVLIALSIKGLFLEGSHKAITFLFGLKWSEVTPQAVLTALGQSFFAMSLGQGTMITYGSYLSQKENVPTTCFPITLFGICVSIFSGLAIFAIVFSAGLPPSSGESLLFQTLPLIFSQMKGGYVLGIAFFLLLVLAALTSQISALEPLISYCIDQKKWKRSSAVAITCGASFFIAIPCALSFGPLSHVAIYGYTIFDFILFFCVNILIPLGGLVAAFIVAWKWGLGNFIDHLRSGADGTFNRYPLIAVYLKISVAIVAPIVIILIFLDAIGILR